MNSDALSWIFANRFSQFYRKTCDEKEIYFTKYSVSHTQKDDHLCIQSLRIFFEDDYDLAYIGIILILLLLKYYSLNSIPLKIFYNKKHLF